MRDKHVIIEMMQKKVKIALLSKKWGKCISILK